MLQNLMFSLNVVIPLFALIFLGYGIKNILDAHAVDKLNKLTFNVAFPVMLFNEVSNADFSQIFDIKLIVFCVLSITAIFIFTWLFAIAVRMDKKSVGAFVQGSFRGSYAVFGIYLVSGIIGEANTNKSALVVTITIFIYNILAVLVLSVYDDNELNAKNLIKDTFIKIIKNPLILSVLISLPLSVTGIAIPHVIQKTLGQLGGIAIPIALLLIGASVDFENIKGNFKLAAMVTFLKLVVFTTIFTAIAILIGMDSESVVVLFVLYASPTTINSYIMAYNMGSNHILAANIVILTTLFSVVSIVVGVFILKTIGIV